MNSSATGYAALTYTSEAAICTLFEGDYHLGLAALINSLVRSGYRGTVWAGYRGSLPPWIIQIRRIAGTSKDEFLVTEHIRLCLIKLSTEMHFANFKPEFMLRLLADEARDFSYIWYFDPDILLTAKWSMFHQWQRYGIALCQEIVDNIFPANAPLRKQWMELAEGIGLKDPRQVDHYYNSGMVGVPSKHKRFLEEWKRLIEMAESLGYDLKFPAQGSREEPFNMRDQDALNIAIMYTDAPLTTLGPQGMGFVLGASMAMYHAVGQKPWRGSLLLRALKGIPPSGAMKCFLAMADEPIHAYSPMRLRVKRLECLLATLIGRFYRRT